MEGKEMYGYDLSKFILNNRLGGVMLIHKLQRHIR